MASGNGTNLAVQRREARTLELRDLLGRAKNQIALALPKHMTPERMARVALTACQKTPQLLDCDTRSVVGAVIQASQLGLEPDGVLGHAYLVPYKDQCQLIVGYRGLIELTRRSGQISTIFARIVYEKDDWDFSYGIEPTLKHVPTDADDPGKMLAAYAVCRLRDGGVQYEWMWKRQIDAIKNRSPAGNRGPWVTDYEEMAKKTVLRRLCKMLPVSVELARATNLDEMHDAGLDQQNATLLDLGTVDAITNGSGSKLDRLAAALDEPKVNADGEVIEEGGFDIGTVGVALENAPDLEAVTRIYDEYCGPESIYGEDEREQVSKLVKERTAALRTKPTKKGQGELLDKGSPSAVGA